MTEGTDKVQANTKDARRAPPAAAAFFHTKSTPVLFKRVGLTREEREKQVHGRVKVPHSPARSIFSLRMDSGVERVHEILQIEALGIEPGWNRLHARLAFDH